MNKEVSPLKEKQTQITLSSKKKWFWLGIAIAIISPISGIVLAIAFWTEKDLKKQGKIIFILSLIWGILFLYLTDWLTRQGYLPV